MKKATFAITMLLMSALFLAACANGSTNQGTQGILGVPTLPLNNTPIVTPIPGGLATSTAPVMETGTPAAMQTSTAPVLETGTPAAMETGTPQAAIPSTGGVLMSNLLNASIVDNSGAAVGSVTGLVLSQSALTTAQEGLGSAAGTPATTGTPASTTGTPRDDRHPAANATLAATPTANAAGTGTGAAMNNPAPQVSYVLVNPDPGLNLVNNTNGSGTLMVPLAAFDMAQYQPSMSGGASMSNSSAGAPAATTGTPAATTGTPAANATLAATTPTANAAGNGTAMSGANTLTMKVGADTLTQAPLLTQDQVTNIGSASLNSQLAAFWDSLGLSLPVTGPQGSHQMRVVNSMDNLQVADAQNNNLGQIADLVIDPLTGQITYALLTGSSIGGANGQYVPVPMNQLQWSPLENNPTSLGTFNYNGDVNAFQNAPGYNTPDEFYNQLMTPDWSTSINNYWNGQAAPSTNP